MVSTAASGKPNTNQEPCSPRDFHPTPSIAYRLARVAAGDGVCGVSLYSVSAHDVVASHALLIAAKEGLVDEHGSPIKYQTQAEMHRVDDRTKALLKAALIVWSKPVDSTVAPIAVASAISRRPDPIV